MIVSVNWLKKFTNIEVPIDDLSELIGARLVEIESVEGLGKKYLHACLVRVVSSQPIPDTDHLNLVKIDDKSTVECERDADGNVQVVCGADNLREGMIAVWLPPKSTVPSTVGTTEPFVIDSRELRGHMSHGMLASPKELGLFDEHEGILEVTGDNLEPGQLFADAFDLNDYLLDVENKSLTHRPDCFGIIGFAREVAAIQGVKFETPAQLEVASIDFDKARGDKPISGKIIDHEMCGRYVLSVLDGVDTSRSSPTDVQTFLARMGVRPINAAVDVTNWIMLLTGQPLHAFDYDKVLKVSGGSSDITVRGGRANEKLELLDGRVIKLDSEDIVITAGDKPIALAGAMGGASTAIDENTKTIVIESASFNLYNLRTTQMRHGIFTDAITRFTKGQPVELAAPALSWAIDLMNEWAGAKLASKIVDEGVSSQEREPIVVSCQYINDFLGSDFEPSGVASILENAEFEVHVSRGNLSVTAPYWRPDVNIIEDVIEEVGRLTGFDLIEPTLPERSFVAVGPDDFDVFRSKLRKSLVAAGANEVLTYSFVHGDVLKKAEQSPENSYKVVNSISPDLQYYRQSLTPGLLGLVHPNIKQGFGNFALFEMNKTHPKNLGLDDEGVPVEADKVALVIAGKKASDGASYYLVKRYADRIARVLGVEFGYKELIHSDLSPDSLQFETKRSARVVDKKADKVIGVVGEFLPAVRSAFKLPQTAAGLELDLRALFESYVSTETEYYPLSRYPSAERDICFQVDSGVLYEEIVQAAESVNIGEGVRPILSPVDIYEPAEGKTKNVTLKVVVTPYNETLSGKELQKITNKIADKVVSAVHAKVI
jgi:phenylalanyl-tRNA synthetase beta chain